MKDSIFLYAAVMLAGVLISSISQISLKKAADREYPDFLSQYLNPRVIISYGFFFGATICTVFAYKGIPLSMGPILEATSYIYVAVLGHFFLHEKITRKKLISLLLIIAGICVYTVS